MVLQFEGFEALENVKPKTVLVVMKSPKGKVIFFVERITIFESGFNTSIIQVRMDFFSFLFVLLCSSSFLCKLNIQSLSWFTISSRYACL